MESCYAATRIRVSSTMTEIAEWTKMRVTFLHIARIVDPPRGQISLDEPVLTSELKLPARPDEAVIASQQLEASCRTLLPSRVADRSATEIR